MLTSRYARRVFTGYALTALLSVLVLSVAALTWISRDVRSRTRAELRRQAGLARALAGETWRSPSDGAPPLREFRRLRAELESHVTLLTSDGRVIASRKGPV